ncbi:MAG TPA: D-cysteine desulfhydrase family protein [Bacteroidales bacterium]|nr:D-cysteine desulfhydrase family protein [Bacteroidales bacterium]HPS18393.1 D-cysteine desulfhydrase family protein [Bacteroidales bacterium]
MILNNKINLGFLPTPLHKMVNLSKKYSDFNIFIKRDDNTGLASGGNKTRKLEYLIYEAINNNCNTIITAGAQQSNHCRQTVAACAASGIECHLMLDGTDPEKYNGNLLLSHLLGAHFHFNGGKRKGEDISLLKTELEANGKRCYVIPYGGSNITGALGYVNAVKELKQQLTELNLEIDYIFFASSSGGTQAGLTLGKDLFELNSELVPINIDKAETNGLTLEEVVLNIITDGKKLFNFRKDYQLKDIKLIKGYDENGYGVVTNDEISAIKELATTEGILLDPVYTARAFHGMLDFIKNKKIRSNSNVLFWHTGGLPANFYYAEKLK